MRFTLNNVCERPQGAGGTFGSVPLPCCRGRTQRPFLATWAGVKLCSTRSSACVPREPCGCSLTHAAQAGNGGGDVSVPPAPRSPYTLRPPTHTLTPVLSLVCGSTAALTLTTTLCPGTNRHPVTTVGPVSWVCTEAGAARVEPGPSCCHHGDTSTANKTIRDLTAHWGKPMVTEVSRARDRAGGHGRQDDRPQAKAHVSQGHHQAPMILPPQERPRAWSSACVQEGHHLPAQPVPRRWLVPRGLAPFSLHLELDGSRSLDCTPGGRDSVFLSLFLPVSSKQISVLSFPTNAWKTLSVHHTAGTHPQVLPPAARGRGLQSHARTPFHEAANEPKVSSVREARTR